MSPSCSSFTHANFLPSSTASVNLYCALPPDLLPGGSNLSILLLMSSPSLLCPRPNHHSLTSSMSNNDDVLSVDRVRPRRSQRKDEESLPLISASFSLLHRCSNRLVSHLHVPIHVYRGILTWNGVLLKLSLYAAVIS